MQSSGAVRLYLQALWPQGKAGDRWHQPGCAVVPTARARGVLVFKLAGVSQGSARLWEHRAAPAQCKIPGWVWLGVTSGSAWDSWHLSGQVLQGWLQHLNWLV